MKGQKTMKQYIGTKIVEAEPATLYELKEGGHFMKKASEEWTEENARIPDLASSTRGGYAPPGGGGRLHRRDPCHYLGGEDHRCPGCLGERL